MQQLVDLLKEMSELPAGSVSDVTLQQVEEIYRSSLKKIKSREASVEASTQSPEKDKAVAGGRASGASVGSDSGSRWAYVPGDGTSQDISGKKDSGGLPSLAGADAASKKSGKETIITDSSHCAQCGTPKSLHAPLKHEFVAGDDVRPASVGGSSPASDRSIKPSSDTAATPTIKVPSFTPGGAAKRGGVPTTPLSAPAAPPGGAPSKPSFFKEDINQLPVADQMRSWRQLMEADPPKLIVGPDQSWH